MFIQRLAHHAQHFILHVTTPALPASHDSHHERFTQRVKGRFGSYSPGAVGDSSSLPNNTHVRLLAVDTVSHRNVEGNSSTLLC